MSPRINIDFAMLFKDSSVYISPGGVGALLYTGYIGMCHTIGYMVFEVLDPKA